MGLAAAPELEERGVLAGGLQAGQPAVGAAPGWVCGPRAGREEELQIGSRCRSTSRGGERELQAYHGLNGQF